jgi:hypothetical protein
VQCLFEQLTRVIELEKYKNLLMVVLFAAA